MSTTSDHVAVAVGNDLGEHYRRIGGFWYKHIPGRLPVLVTVQRRIDSLNDLANSGAIHPNQPDLFGDAA